MCLRNLDDTAGLRSNSPACVYPAAGPCRNYSTSVCGTVDNRCRAQYDGSCARDSGWSENHN